MSRQLLTIYGTEFEELDQEQAKLGAPKKPTAIQDQVAKDEQGRRRFHGAFTGGFSAGYFMTVGSKEGWQPAEFRSSRDERSNMGQMRPEDLMDKEDLGEFGIGARRIRQTEAFAGTGGGGAGGKRRMAWEHDVTTNSSLAHQLEGMVKAAKTSIGVQMLRAMGWKEGRGVGMATVKQVKTRGGDSSSAAFDREQAAKVAPGYDLSLEDELVVQLTPCTGSQGLGYTGLNETNVLDEKWGKLEAVLKAESLQKKGKKGIRGQAFGVGAFEDEDESVYTQFDMAQYDFALEGPGGSEQKAMAVDFSFEEMPQRLKPRTFYNPPRLPDHWKPNHKSIPIDVGKLPDSVQKAMKELTVEQRARLLGEDRIAVVKEAQKTGARAREGERRSRWDIKAEQIEQEKKSDPNRVVFPDEPMKQRRFKEFLSYTRRGLPWPKPTDMSVWEWESEKKDFEAKLTAEERGMLPEVHSRSEPLARSNLALPIKELMNSKFTKETGTSGLIGRKDEDKLSAVRMGMFGDRTRSMFEWYPDNVLARRFNVPNPYPGATFSGCPHLQKSTRKAETLVNLGLPNTAAELVISRRQQEPERKMEVEAEEEEEEVEEKEIENKPPVSIFDAIFGDLNEEESEEESSSEDEQRKEREKTVDVDSDDSDASQKQRKKEKEDSPIVVLAPPQKVMTVMDLFKNEQYGPALPPQTFEQEAGPSGFSVLRHLQDELKERKKKRSKEDRHKKHKKEEKHKKERKHSKKSKKEKKSKKDKKEKKKSKKHHRSETPTLSSDSDESSSDSDCVVVE